MLKRQPEARVHDAGAGPLLEAQADTPTEHLDTLEHRYETLSKLLRATARLAFVWAAAPTWLLLFRPLHSYWSDLGQPAGGLPLPMIVFGGLLITVVASAVGWLANTTVSILLEQCHLALRRELLAARISVAHDRQFSAAQYQPSRRPQRLG